MYNPVDSNMKLYAEFEFKLKFEKFENFFSLFG
jgi:hypothetical protein